MKVKYVLNAAVNARSVKKGENFVSGSKILRSTKGVCLIAEFSRVREGNGGNVIDKNLLKGKDGHACNTRVDLFGLLCSCSKLRWATREMRLGMRKS